VPEPSAPALRSRIFFDEREAQRLTLSPRLPHQRRHPLTADEALAGLILAIALLAALGSLVSRAL